MSSKKTRQYVARRLLDSGLNATAVAGSLGNISAESAFNPKALNGSSGAVAGGPKDRVAGVRQV